jgi:hypothetical protein
VTDALAEYIEELRADETAVGLLLHGSRALGLERQDSDYDLICSFPTTPTSRGRRTVRS